MKISWGGLVVVVSTLKAPCIFLSFIEFNRGEFEDCVGTAGSLFSRAVRLDLLFGLNLGGGWLEIISSCGEMGCEWCRVCGGTIDCPGRLVLLANSLAKNPIFGLSWVGEEDAEEERGSVSSPCAGFCLSGDVLLGCSWEWCV